MKNFFKTKGYYLVLIVCIVTTCIGGVVALQRSEESNQEMLALNTATPGKGGKQSPSPTDLQVMNPVTPEPSKDPQGEANATPAPVKMTKPVEGEITQVYAADKLVYNKTLQEWRTHKGLDFAAAADTEVLCAYKGAVTDVKYDPRYGDTVVVDHGEGLVTVYCGVKPAEGIQVGKALEAGEILGTVSGDVFCEKEDGAHIHFEVFQNENSRNPEEYFK